MTSNLLFLIILHSNKLRICIYTLYSGIIILNIFLIIGSYLIYRSINIHWEMYSFSDLRNIFSMLETNRFELLPFNVSDDLYLTELSPFSQNYIHFANSDSGDSDGFTSEVLAETRAKYENHLHENRGPVFNKIMKDSNLEVNTPVKDLQNLNHRLTRMETYLNGIIPQNELDSISTLKTFTTDALEDAQQTSKIEERDAREILRSPASTVATAIEHYANSVVNADLSKLEYEKLHEHTVAMQSKLQSEYHVDPISTTISDPNSSNSSDQDE